ncbi:PEPxxWA-CTERM sorting domain-containing protein [Sphingomonas sp. PAMC 26621]|uniref:PEPxxWA-CTERM sorting domain-containing protein n=1 Tax=Sphingomonas sp. PAMC 26621 TaxID=1112213 RepID=UPI0002893848|nr:PEPxxWA-CTERM sorting domain-containing protein [Sphingomonas sp. PAMC 26621]
MKRIGYLFAMSAMAASAPATATSIVWTLSGVEFSDGGTASGTFSIDSDTGAALGYDITTSAGTALCSYHYTDQDGFVFRDYFTKNSIMFFNPEVTRYTVFTFLKPLTSGITNDISTAYSSYECRNCGDARFVISGFATSSIPEPATWTLMLAGFGLVGFALRKGVKPMVRVTYT